MSFEPDPLQRLLLFRLAVSEEGGEFLKEIESDFSPARRGPLSREGLIEEQKRKISGKGRGLTYLELTEKGWGWCQQHLDEPFRFRGQTPKLAGVVLERLLSLLKGYFEAQDQTPSLGKFILQASRGSQKPADDSHRDNGRENLESALGKAFRELGGGRENVRVRLSDLRGRFGSVARSSLDETLLRMEREGKLSLLPLDNPAEITAADRQAVLRTNAGSERHILYFGGTGS